MEVFRRFFRRTRSARITRSARRTRSARIFFVGVVASAFLLCGCGGTKVVLTESVKTDSVYILKLERDSVFLKDSVREWVKGDSVVVYKDRYRYEYKLLHDTVRECRVDSVPYLVEVVREKPLTAWQKTKLKLGGYSFLFCLFSCMIMLWRLRKLWPL